MQTEKSFDTGELTLKYVEGGTGAPMVLLHGLTAQKLGWYALLPEPHANIGTSMRPICAGMAIVGSRAG